MRREMLQRYERSASQLLCRLEESLGQAAAWEAGSLSAVSAAETCHGLITDVRIAGATTVVRCRLLGQTLVFRHFRTMNGVNCSALLRTYNLLAWLQAQCGQRNTISQRW